MTGTAAWGLEPDVGTQAQRDAGKVIYNKRCAQCHGVDGDGKGIAHRFLKPWPRDFTRGMYKFKSTPDDRLPTTEDIIRVIREGNSGTGMPAWPIFSSEELRNLAYHVKSFSKDFSDPEVLKDEQIAPIPLPIPGSAPKWSNASAEKGKELFIENKCQDCHALSGRGSGTSAPTTEDMDGNQIRPRDLTKRWNFRNGSTRIDIFRTLSMGIAPMPSFHNLPEEARWNLVDYVYSLGERSESKYGEVIVSSKIAGPIDLAKGTTPFEDAPKVRLPVVGQITQPGRAFYASIEDAEVQSVYNDEEIAFLLRWNDMTPEINQPLGGASPAAVEEEDEGWGEEETADTKIIETDLIQEQWNSPDIKVPLFDPSTAPVKETPRQFSDAVALQIPAKEPDGVIKPYFIFGDKNKGVDFWFADMANDLDSAQHWIAKGALDITRGNDLIDFWAEYHEGRWSAIFKRKRMKNAGVSFREDGFTPVAFSFWDGFNNERGNKRGLTGWAHVYLKPEKKDPVNLKMFGAFLVFLVLELTVVYFVRRSSKSREA